MSNLIATIKSRIKTGEFLRNVLILLTGTTIAQVISGLVSPILTRVYSPEDFGVFALFFAISNIIVGISTGTYEATIVLPEKDEDGFDLVVLSCLIVLGVSSVSAVFFIVFNEWMTYVLKNPDISIWLYAVPGMVLLCGIHNVFNHWYNRKKEYKRMAGYRTVRSLVIACAKLSLGFAGFVSSGLILAWFLGQTLVTGLYGLNFLKENAGLRARVTWKSVKRVASRYKNFPKFLILCGLVESSSAHTIMIILSSFFGAATLGIFSLAFAMVNLPMSLIANAVREVFYQTASERWAKTGNCRPIFVRTLKRLLLLSLPPFFALLFLGPWMFEFVFGERWRMSGVFAQIMAITFALRLVTNPLSSMFFIAEKLKLEMVLQLSFFAVLMLSTLITVFLTENSYIVIGVYATVYSLKYVVELILSYTFTVKPGPTTVSIDGGR